MRRKTKQDTSVCANRYKPSSFCFRYTTILLLLPLLKANTHEVTVTPTVGAGGLGLIFAEEKEGTGWVVEGFQPMPDGERNPAKVGVGHCSVLGWEVGFARIRCFVSEKAGLACAYYTDCTGADLKW